MKFTDYTPEQLIGMNVLVEGTYNKWIGVIEEVNKASFKATCSDMLFSFSGIERGGGTWNKHYAKLITKDEAFKIKQEWKNKKDKKQAIDQITPMLQHLSLEELKSVLNLITK